jgi:hypothetical protein
MPMHDWTAVDSGTYHHFHQDWTIELCRRLNAGVLPAGYFAMADQRVGEPEPDVTALQRTSPVPPVGSGGLAVLDTPPRTMLRATTSRLKYARKANRISVRHRLGRVVAVIGIVSPGNKDSENAVAAFSRKAVAYLRQNVHFLMVDPFPPTARDPQGLHNVIWEAISEEQFEPPPADKPLAASAFDAGEELTAYVEPLAVGDGLPDMPLFLEPGVYVPCPLEAAYATSWATLPAELRDLLPPLPG